MKYEELEMEIVSFYDEDVIVTSPTPLPFDQDQLLRILQGRFFALLN